MFTHIQKRFSLNIAVLLLLCVCLLALTPEGRSAGAAQLPQQKKIVEFPAWRIMPLEITNVKISGKQVKLDEEFEAEGEGWFKDFSVTFRNITGKDIKHFYFYATFPDTDNGHSIVISNEIRFGRYPNLDEPPDERDAILLPGEEIEINLPPQYYANLMNLLKRRQQPAESLRILRLALQTVYFTDDTSWYGGKWFRRKAPDSMEFIRIEP